MRIKGLFAIVSMLLVLVWGAACASQPAAPAAPAKAPEPTKAAAAAPTKAPEAPKPAATEPPKAAPAQAPAAKISFPEKPVTIIVPSPAGGSVDREARQAAEALKGIFPQPVAVVNRPGGAAGSVGTVEVVQARPDGYTVGLVLNAGLTVQPLLATLPYNTPADYAPVNNMINLILMFVVRADAPWKTMKDALDYAKANPGKIRVGTPGEGTLSHFNLEMMKDKAKIDMTHVPQAGDAESVTAVLGGHLEAMVAAPGSVKPQVDAGRLKVLAIYTDRPDPMFPGVPTMKEVGYDVAFTAYHPVIAPRGTPDAIVGVLDQAFKRAMESDTFKKYATETSLNLYYEGPAALKARIERDLKMSADVIKLLGLKKS